MKLRPYLLISGIFFAAVAIIHLIRAIMGLPVFVDSLEVAVWPSWGAVVLTGYLAYSAFRLMTRVN
jgi:hypothetical protein